MSQYSFFEAAVPEGLETVAQNELRMRLGGQEQILAGQNPGLLQFTHSGNPAKLLQLRTAFSIFWALRFDVPRPRVLMGHQNFQAVFHHIETIQKLSPKGSFQTLHMAAAGSESEVMTRFAEEIAGQLGLTVSRREGDLLIRLRRPLDGSAGWDVLVRMSPRPLSARKWRICDLPGGVSAVVAHALALMSRPRPEETMLDPLCGSGTMLIERAAAAPSTRLMGFDSSPEALACAHANIASSGFANRIAVYPWDSRNLPLDSGSIDVICSPLPFEMDEETHDKNLLLYPQILREAARVAKPSARCLLLSNEDRLMDTLLDTYSAWQVEKVSPITVNRVHSRIYQLRRKDFS